MFRFIGSARTGDNLSGTLVSLENNIAQVNLNMKKVMSFDRKNGHFGA